MDAEKEFMNALADLRDELRALHIQSLETARAMEDVVNSTHIRSLLSLLKEDTFLKRLLDVQSNPELHD